VYERLERTLLQTDVDLEGLFDLFVVVCTLDNFGLAHQVVIAAREDNDYILAADFVAEVVQC